MRFEMDFERIIDGEKLVYEGKCDKVFETLINALIDYRENYFPGVKKAYIHTNSKMYGDITVEIDKNMKYWDVKEQFDKLSEEWNKKQMREEARKEVQYKDFEQIMSDLNRIKSCDLTSEKTSIADALTMCKKVMKILDKSESLAEKWFFSSENLTNEQFEQFENKLKELGCCKYKDAADKFAVSYNVSDNIDKLMKRENNVEYPLVAFSQLIDADKKSFIGNLRSMTMTGESKSSCGKWLETQEKAKTKNEIEL